MSLDTIQSLASNQGFPLREVSSPSNTRTETENASAAAQIQQERPDQKPNQAIVEKAVKLLSDFMSDIHAEISFSIDRDSGMQVVKVIDSQSDKVIRQIPSEEAVHIAQALDKLQGLFVKDKA